MSEVVGPPPEKGKARQIVEGVVEGGLSVVPFVGGPLGVLWVQIAGAAYEKRRQAWAEEITASVNDLIERVDQLDAESLAENDQFLDALAYATTTAIATAQREKLEALRNAVLNAAIGLDITADQQVIFLKHVRDLTPSHLKLLKLLNDPPAWFKQLGIPWPGNIRMGGLSTSVVEVGIPEFSGKRALYDQLERDLAAAGLTNSGGLHTMMSGSGLAASRTTDTGKQFIRFISDPREIV